MSAVEELGMDVDELRCRLLLETNEALDLADELAEATQTNLSLWRRRRIAANYGQVRNRIRQLRTLLRVEEGQR